MKVKNSLYHTASLVKGDKHGTVIIYSEDCEVYIFCSRHGSSACVMLSELLEKNGITINAHGYTWLFKKGKDREGKNRSVLE